MVRVFGPRDKAPEGFTVVNTTSTAKGLSRQLSPFLLGPCELYSGHCSRNLENAWQFSKVYPQHLDETGNPSEEYWRWAKSGWRKSRAERYPMGKGAIPSFALWNGKHLGYVDSRKKIYVPLYSTAVKLCPAYSDLTVRVASGEQLALFDFDGYDHVKLGMSLTDVLNDPTRKMGHAFVLAALLENVELK